MSKYIGIICLLIGVGILIFVIYKNSPFNGQTRIFSSYSLLHTAWEKYRQKYINKDGRVVDFSQNYLTTSEGQSYALLRSVWVDDKPTFDFVWGWTQKNMQRSDSLFGWQWGKRSDGTYGFLSNGGDNPAADADTDIALALILASRRWHSSAYQNQAKKIISSLWTEETATASATNKRYVIAGPWANGQDTLVINPSYFAPYAWRIFAQVDTSHDWKSLINPAYQLLTQLGKSPLDKSKAVGLPPNWVEMNKKTGDLSAPTNHQFTTDYSYDAARVPWRIAVDYIWNKEPLARKYLQQSFVYLYQQYKNKEKLAGLYHHDGTVIKSEEIPFMYATALGFMTIIDKSLAKKMYQEKIVQLYSNDHNTFKDSLGYYDQNWLWLGTALYNNYIVQFQ